MTIRIMTMVKCLTTVKQAGWGRALQMFCLMALVTPASGRKAGGRSMAGVWIQPGSADRHSRRS